MDWFIKGLKQFADFKGRAGKKEFWMFFLFYLIFACAASVIDSILGTHIFSPIYALALLVPYLAISVRRLHDIDKPWTWILICLIPFIGMIILLIMFLRDGNPETNEYGPKPSDVIVKE